jgi:hypothetical protein
MCFSGRAREVRGVYVVCEVWFLVFQVVRVWLVGWAHASDVARCQETLGTNEGWWVEADLGKWQPCLSDLVRGIALSRVRAFQVLTNAS